METSKKLSLVTEDKNENPIYGHTHHIGTVKGKQTKVSVKIPGNGLITLTMCIAHPECDTRQWADNLNNVYKSLVHDVNVKQETELCSKCLEKLLNLNSN